MNDEERALHNVIGKQRAIACMQRFTGGLYSHQTGDQSDALQVYHWLQAEWMKNHWIQQHWKMLMHKWGANVVHRVLHLSTTKDAKVQLECLKCLSFLASSDNITQYMIDTGGMFMVLNILLNGDDTILSESLNLMKRFVESGNYGDEKTVLLQSGLVELLCYSFLSCNNTICDKILEFLFSLIHRCKAEAPKAEVTKVCLVVNHMLQQTEGPLSDREVQTRCLQRVHWHDIDPHWASFVESGLILTLTNGLVKWKGSDIQGEALTILCGMAGEEMAAKVMLDAGILEYIYSKGEENDENEILMLGNMLITCEEVRDRCIKEGVVDFVLKLSVDDDHEMDHSVWALGSVFHPSPKGVPKGYAEQVLPILTKSLKSSQNHVVRTALEGLVNMTSHYEDDQFENVERLLDCGLVPYFVEELRSSKASIRALALLIVNNLAFSKRTSVLKVLIDAGVLANAVSALRQEESYHIAQYEVEVAKLVMWLTAGGFGKDVMSEQTRCFGVLVKKLWKKDHHSNKAPKNERQLQNYTEEDLIDFGEQILETVDLEQIRKLLHMDHAGVFLFNGWEEEGDPLKEKKLKVLVRMADKIHELGYRRLYFFYTYHINEMLKRTKSEETRVKLMYVVDSICSDCNEEKL